MNIHQQRQLLQLSVSLNSLINVRQRMGSDFVDLSWLARAAEEAGADQISLYLPGGKWVLPKADVNQLSMQIINSFELEITPSGLLLDQLQATSIRNICLVSDSASESAQFGVVDLVADTVHLEKLVRELRSHGKRVSAYILPAAKQIVAAATLELSQIRLDCSSYACAQSDVQRQLELVKIQLAVTDCIRYGISVTIAGLLHWCDVEMLAAIQDVSQFHLDEAIFSKALMCGWEGAVSGMKALLIKSRLSHRS